MNVAVNILLDFGHSLPSQEVAEYVAELTDHVNRQEPLATQERTASGENFLGQP